MFNYTLNQQTLFRNIKQLQGGSSISGNYHSGEIEIVKQTDASAALTSSEIRKFDINAAIDKLHRSITDDLDPGMPVALSLSGGFDSKLLLAALLNNKKEFSAYTYGFKGSPDQIAASKTALKCGVTHSFVDSRIYSTDELDERIGNFIDSSSALPLILDLLSYEKVKGELPPSNIVTGVMGGELLVGPVIISEVMLTRSARTLTTSPDMASLKSGLLKDAESVPFLNKKWYTANIDEYISGLRNYTLDVSDINKRNVTRFLLNETYAKFFGVVFSRMLPEFNIVNPFAGPEFLKLVLNSEYRYTRGKLFSQSPFAHFSSRRLYPLIIKELHEPVLFTPMDRNYTMADLFYLYRMPLILKRYIENHLLKRNKTASESARKYRKIFRQLIFEKLSKSGLLESEFIQKQEAEKLLHNLNSGIHVSSYMERKLILMLSLHYVLGKYNISTGT